MSLVESLLEISKMQTGRIELSPSPVNLYTLAAAILADYLQQANDLGILLRNEIPGDLPTIHADPAKLGRVFANLIDNALKFTPTGGQVSISANLQADSRIVVSASAIAGLAFLKNTARKFSSASPRFRGGLAGGAVPDWDSLFAVW